MVFSNRATNSIPQSLSIVLALLTMTDNHFVIIIYKVCYAVNNHMYYRVKRTVKTKAISANENCISIIKNTFFDNVLKSNFYESLLAKTFECY